ncbi:transglycosylase SLT domain-containing protein [Streptomyces sp. NBC_00582]|uniref:aggregation-promoting factor C-terminal-like domain-containing protein n=1 Tax=Streptomyces sp. NBC_00582 TaxID=2975783 RepID=UPI0010634A49|nr:transglycosylase SLT domain-containing protein [Streptomyces sp. NBC_00582]WUB62196.1 transglycosylase SLT domain-containing protein [Streptomyces sp. NBC_00582]
MSRNSARGFAVASATAVTTVGAVMGVAQAHTAQPSDDAQATASDATLLADLPIGEQAQVQTASLTRQATTQAIAADATAKKQAEETARKQAAETAVAKQKAAEEKAQAEKEAKEREEAETKAASASGGSTASFPQQASYTVAEVQAIARQIVPAGQFQCFSNIVNHESTWNYQAVNPTSGAYGLVQAYPGSKMSSAGADWRTNPATQIKWGLNYMNERYGSPCDAWDYWQANGSY